MAAAAAAAAARAALWLSSEPSANTNNNYTGSGQYDDPSPSPSWSWSSCRPSSRLTGIKLNLSPSVEFGRPAGQMGQKFNISIAPVTCSSGHDMRAAS